MSILLGFFGGAFFFYHLYSDSVRAIKEKRNLNFWKRLFLFGLYSTICATILKENFLFFPIGFLISKAIFFFIILKYR